MSAPSDRRGSRAPARDPVDGREAMLAQLGQGYAWHLDDEPRWRAILHQVRRAVAEDDHVPGTSPLTPEGAVAFAGRLAATLDATSSDGAQILLLDTDPRLADALLGLGHDVVAWVPSSALPLWAGAARRNAGLTVVERGVHEVPAPGEERAFDAAVVDLSSAPVQWALRLSLASWATRVGGRLALALHPQQREHGRGQLTRLSASMVARHDESCPRLVATAGVRGPPLAMADALADQWILEVLEGALPIDPTTPRSLAVLDDLDPPFARHGVCEVHDVHPDVDAEALERALALAVSRAGMEMAGGHGHVRDGYVHRFVALRGGGHIAVTLDRAAGLLNCGGWRWTPALESALASAFLDEVERDDAPVILSPVS